MDFFGEYRDPIRNERGGGPKGKGEGKMVGSLRKRIEPGEGES